VAVEAKDLQQGNEGREKPVVNETRTLRTLIDGFATYDAQAALLSFTKTASSTLGYKTFVHEIRNTAAGLQTQGIKKGDCIVFFAANSPAWVISALAVIYCGATVVPIDSQQSDEVLLHILDDSSAGWIFTDERGSKRLEKILHQYISQKSTHRIVRLDLEDTKDSWKQICAAGNRSQEVADPVAAAKSGTVFAPIVATDFAVLFYTSGTTGMPKGVPLNHINMLLQLDAISKMNLLKPADRVLLPLPLFHVYPLNIGLLAPLMTGLTIILPYSITGPEIMRSINEGDVSIMLAVPGLLRALYQSIAARFHKNKVIGTAFDLLLAYCQWMDRVFGLRPGRLLFAAVRQKFGCSLRLFACGGAPLEADLASKLRAFGWEVAVGYGLTETSPLLTLRMPEDRELESVGTPIPGVEVKIEPLKERDDQIEKDAGEILARGANVFTGYQNRPDLNKEAFTAGGWFRTGDLGLLRKEHLYVIGRASSTIVMEGGEKIQPENVEDRIAKQAGIAEIGLLQVEHKLVALVVPDLKVIGDKDVKNAVAEALKTVSAELASYLQITSFAITRERLPRTNLGKLKRHELKERFEKARLAETSDDSGKAAAPLADLNSTDQILIEEPAAASCLEWLKKKFPHQQITLDTSPQLDLNIDSLEWMNLTLELVEETGVELSAEAISRVTTVRELLNEIVSSAQGGHVAPSPLEDPNYYLNDQQREFLMPLTPWQAAVAHGLYWFDLLLTWPFKVKAVGYDCVPAEQCVFIPNHASYMDPFVLAAALPYGRLRNTQWAGWTGIAFGNPVFSRLSRLSRVFPIEAKQSLFASIALGVSVLKAGSNLVWFPEGERTLDGQLLPFKHGIGLLLAKSDVMVVPMYLDGTRDALPPGAYFPSFRRVTVIFGEPVKPEQLAKEGKGTEAPERIANALHERVAALSRKVAQHID
jgi:long-chain acyl-CoA synthetase